MHRIEKYGICLRPMAHGDLEQVRRWRNAPHVVRQMAFQEEISPVMQEEWWQQLDPLTNFYWIIEYQGHGIGVVHAKDIDWQARTAEAGIFVGDADYLLGFVPVLGVLAMMDALFEDHGLVALRAKVKGNHEAILDFNRRLGYKVMGEEGGFLYLQVSRTAYLEVAKGLREKAEKLKAKS